MEAASAANVLAGSLLTRAEWLREVAIGLDWENKGNLHEALDRLITLLKHIEAQPEGAQLGRGSYEHCVTLRELALGFLAGGFPSVAEQKLHEALSFIDALIDQQPTNDELVRQRGKMLKDLGDVLSEQGKYEQALDMYEERLKIAREQMDLRGLAVVLASLGNLAHHQREYTGAQSYYTEALPLFRALGEHEAEADIWYNLGTIAVKQERWTEAEQYLKESLVFREQSDSLVDTTSIYFHLALIAQRNDRASEAEGWYKQTLKLCEQIDFDLLEKASILTKLAHLLLHEVEESRTSVTRLTEAQDYAQQALAILETGEDLSETWRPLNILADIAYLEDRVEVAKGYRRRAQEIYASDLRNRSLIDRDYLKLIAATAAATKGDAEARKWVEGILPVVEEKGWHITAAIQRIWAGERDWYLLAEEVNPLSALLVLRILEFIEQPTEHQSLTWEQISSLLLNALQQDDKTSFNQIFEALPPEVQFELLAQAIGMAIAGGAAEAGKIPSMLDDLEGMGWHLTAVVRRIWAGERDANVLTEGLTEQDESLVQKILEIITGK